MDDNVKRGDLIGILYENGVVWVNTKTGESYIEKYEKDAQYTYEKEEIYGEYYDTVGKHHWIGTQSGYHIG